LSFKTLTIRL